MKKAILATLIIVLVAVVYGVLSYSCANVGGIDMMPAVGKGGTVIIERRAEPARGDIVLFELGGKARLRRVIGLPGDDLTFDGLAPTVNGEAASYEDVYDIEMLGKRMTVKRETVAGTTQLVIDDPNRRLTNVPPSPPGDGYYVMSDHREYGTDSRIFGRVRKDLIRGVVIKVWDPGETAPRAR